ncbi:hypothetical protein CR203_19610 [Salipaludibacillus neizhouensis]|uniref:AMP nucleosidase n=1 Tax=Salipaludibacillus neizhouensis TaxID=885475 RepID=A0A3A9KDX6_9BACI|nr:LOG family protein [Salipaludibacillus neizhouensis]RKL65685.1 hypothetical protein CR203_19610 [Salipaludibacillus neizhouensis]
MLTNSKQPLSFDTVVCQIWAQLGYHHKPCALLNINDYYTPIAALFDHMVSQGFVKVKYRKMVVMENDATTLIDRITNYKVSNYINRKIDFINRVFILKRCFPSKKE